jgi:cbb3-type cytochrome oxidase subunit 1
MWKGFAHQAFGFVAAGMVVAALFYFLSPYAEQAVGSDRLGIFRVVVIVLFAIYGIRLFARLVGLVGRKD